MFDTGETCWPPAKGTAAPNAADEEVTRNSLRVDLSEDDMGLRELTGRAHQSGKNRGAALVSLAGAPWWGATDKAAW